MGQNSDDDEEDYGCCCSIYQWSDDLNDYFLMRYIFLLKEMRLKEIAGRLMSEMRWRKLEGRRGRTFV